ncbi:MAG: hypothetical protein IM552_08960, partial [Chitinophagaceae bacterium]|nr:hypothetical protein [Chitinophagaceae bacterium]
TGSNAVSISGTVRNTTNSIQTLTYSVTTVSGGCVGLPFTVIALVNPTPEVSAMSRVVCNGVQFTVSPVNDTNGIVPESTLYTWNTPLFTASITGGDSGSDLPFIRGTLTNESNVAQQAYYNVFPRLGNCYGAPFSLTIYLNPTPVITQMTTVTCSGVFFNITPVDGTNGIVPVGTKYRWAEPQIVGGTIIGGESKSGQDGIFGYLVNRTNVVHTATYTVIPSIANCGDGAPFTVVVSVNPRAEIGVLSTVICSGSTFEISPTVGFAGNIVPAGTRYSWSLPAYTGSFTGLSTGSNAVSISGTVRNTWNSQQTLTYSVTTLSGDCAGLPFTVVVSVNPRAEIGVLSTVICSGSTFEISPTVGFAGNIVPAGTRYSWSLPAYTGSFTGLATGSNAVSISGTVRNTWNSQQTLTYSVTTLSGDCAGLPFTVVVSVNPTPEIGVLSTVTCSGVLFQVSPAATFGGRDIVTVDTKYSWGMPTYTTTFTGGDSGTSQTHIFGRIRNTLNTQQTATYIVTPRTDLGGCQGTPFTVTVTVNPTAEITGMSTVVCSGYPFEFSPSNTANGIVPNNTRYTWNLPTASGTFTGGQTATLADRVSGLLFNQTNTTQTVTYIVTPSSFGNCTGATFTVTVILRSTPVINTITSAVCSNTPFTITPSGASPNILPAGTTYTWSAPAITASISGGAPGTNESQITGLLTNLSNVVQTATYTVYPTSGLNCAGNPFTITITLNPGATITTIFTTVCSGVTFNVVPENGVDGIIPAGTTYIWDAPTGAGISGGQSTTTYQNPITGTLTNTTGFNATATYVVTPNILNCGPSISFSLVVTIKPVATPTSFTAIAFGGVPFEFSP